VIDQISPNSVQAGGASAAGVLASLTLTVEGSSLVSGTQIFWNGTALRTIAATDRGLSVQISDTLFSTAGVAQITARSPENITSNAFAFVVEAAAPVITSLSPNRAETGDEAITVTVDGSNFAANSTVLWNGVALPTQFVNASQLRVTVGAELLESGQLVGVAVSNPTPTVQISSLAAFEVFAPLSTRSFIPSLYR
jgi:alpha-D-ribose 1-methylphosphonate 5-triphosphate synthase subunit PhnH